MDEIKSLLRDQFPDWINIAEEGAPDGFEYCGKLDAAGYRSMVDLKELLDKASAKFRPSGWFLSYNIIHDAPDIHLVKLP